MREGRFRLGRTAGIVLKPAAKAEARNDFIDRRNGRQPGSRTLARARRNDRHSLAMCRPRLCPEPTPPEVHRVGFAPVIVAAGAEPVVAAAPVNGRMVIIVGKDRQSNGRDATPQLVVKT